MTETALSVLTEGMNLDPDDDFMKDLNTLFKSMKSNNLSMLIQCTIFYVVNIFLLIQKYQTY